MQSLIRHSITNSVLFQKHEDVRRYNRYVTPSSCVHIYIDSERVNRYSSSYV